jgi:hypothetical protein
VKGPCENPKPWFLFTARLDAGVPFACTWAIAWNTHLSPVFIPKLACVRLLNAVGHRQRESCLMLFIGDPPVKPQ